MSVSRGRPAVFVDRDGTITREGEWILHPGALELVPGAGLSVRRLHAAGFLVVMYTNQSAVARGLITESELEGVHARLQGLLAEAGDRLDAIYVCPHHPTEGLGPYRVVCTCRKPKPGLIVRAEGEMGIDLERSWCVGDMLRDLEAGQAAGVRGILVATGKGQGEFLRASAEGRAPAYFEPDVGRAVDRILASDARISTEA